MRLNVELRFARSDLGHRLVEYARLFRPDRLSVDDGLVGGHVAESVRRGGVPDGDIGVHRVDIDDELGAYVGEERCWSHSAIIRGEGFGGVYAGELGEREGGMYRGAPGYTPERLRQGAGLRSGGRDGAGPRQDEGRAGDAVWNSEHEHLTASCKNGEAERDESVARHILT